MHPLRKRLYVSIFDLGLAQRIASLTSAWPAGFEIEPGATFTLGQAANGRLKGLEVGWSKQLPEDAVRSESLVAIVTDKPCDLTALETPGATSDWTAKGTRSIGGNPLQQLVSQVQFGGTRDIRSREVGEVGDDGYVVRHLSFELSPWPLPPPGEGFVMDECPPTSVRLFAPRSLARPPRKLALRITGLVVHDTKALFGSANIRIDTLVVTRLPSGGTTPYRAETARFQGIRDGEIVPLGNWLVYHGDVRDFLDLRVWVSRDRDDSRSLAELLKDQANSTEFQEAAGALLAVTATAAAIAPVVAANGATATLTAIAWRVLAAALPKSAWAARRRLGRSPSPGPLAGHLGRPPSSGPPVVVWAARLPLAPHAVARGLAVVWGFWVRSDRPTSYLVVLPRCASLI